MFWDSSPRSLDSQLPSMHSQNIWTPNYGWSCSGWCGQTRRYSFLRHFYRYKKARADHTVDCDMVLCRNLKIFCWAKWIQTFLTIQQSKKVLRSCSEFWQFFQLRKIARLLGDESQTIWTPNYQVCINSKSEEKLPTKLPY